MNYQLSRAVIALHGLDIQSDRVWLLYYVRERQGGGSAPCWISGYSLSAALSAAREAAADLTEQDLETLAPIIEDHCDRCSKQPTRGGKVEIKSFKKLRPIRSVNGEPPPMPIDYTYCYIRQYAGKDQQGKSRRTSIYADCGNGSAWLGGCVAATLNQKLITKSEILDAWSAGKEAYGQFIDKCKTLLRPPLKNLPPEG